MSAEPEWVWWENAYLSGEYQKHWEYSHPSAELVALTAAGIIPRGGLALDIGSGSGCEAAFLVRSGVRAIALDFSGAALKLAWQRRSSSGRSLNPIRSSVLALPVVSSSVDFVNDRGCFHGITSEHRASYAAEQARVLKPGGILFLRGCGNESDEFFVPITREAIERYFDDEFFMRGEVLPYELISNSGKLNGNMIVMRRR